MSEIAATVTALVGAWAVGIITGLILGSTTPTEQPGTDTEEYR